MAYACTAQPEPLPIIREECLILNRGDDIILLGNSAGSIRSDGTPIPPGSNLIMDLAKPRWICACAGTQKYDILPGGRSSTPSSTEIATQLIESGLAGDIGTQTAQGILDSNLSGQIATSLLLTGTRIVDKPVTVPFGPIDNYNYTLVGVPIQDMTDAQSVTIAWSWEILQTNNLTSFGELIVQWWSTVFGGVPFGRDLYEIAAPNGAIDTPGVVGTSEVGVIQLPVRAPGMSLAFFGHPAPGAAGRVRCSGSIMKSYRVTQRGQWSTDAAADRSLGFAQATGVAAGAVSGATAFAPYEGPIELHAWCSATATVNSHVRIGYGSDSYSRRIGVVSPPMEDVMYYPANNFGAWNSRQAGGSTRRPLYVRFFNGEAAARDFAAWVTCGTGT